MRFLNYTFPILVGFAVLLAIVCGEAPLFIIMERQG